VRQGPFKRPREREKKYLSEKYLLTQKKRLPFDLKALKQRERISFKKIKYKGHFYDGKDSRDIGFGNFK
jgi:hypothetical protein